MATAISSTVFRRRLDELERLIIVLLYVYLVYRFAGALSANPLNAVYLVTEGIVMLMVLLRRTTDQFSAAPRDWFVASRRDLCVDDGDPARRCRRSPTPRRYCSMPGSPSASSRSSSCAAVSAGWVLARGPNEAHANIPLLSAAYQLRES